MAHPILINRPLVVSPLGVKLCRPSDVVLELLPAPATGRACEGGRSDGRRSNRRAAVLRHGDLSRQGRARPPRHVLLRALSELVGGALHRRRHHPRPCAARPVRQYRLGRNGASQSRGRGADLADDRADAAQDRFYRIGIGAAALERYRRHPARQLGGQTLLDGAARHALPRPSVRDAAAAGRSLVLYRRADPARRRALHGDGVRLVEPMRGRAQFHAEPGGA